jgi:DNA-binding transcriptional LysR family regulator
MKQHPGVDLLMDVTNKSKVIESLDRNEVDFSLVSIIPDTMQVNRIELLPNKLYLVGASGSKIPAQVSVKKLFEELPLIFRENGSGTRQTMEKFLEKHHLVFRKKMELTSNEAVKQAVLAGLGYSIMPLIGIKNELKNGDMKIIPVKGLPIKTAWQLIWLKGKKTSPVASAFLEYVTREKVSVTRQFFPQVD